MGAATIKHRTRGGASGSSAFPAVPWSGTVLGTGAAVGNYRTPAAAAGVNTPLKMAIVQWNGTSSYATGGETADWSVVGLDTSPLLVMPLELFTEGAGTTGALGTGNILCWEYVYSTDKFKMYQDTAAAGALAEVTAATNVSTFLFTALVIGT